MSSSAEQKCFTFNNTVATIDCKEHTSSTAPPVLGQNKADAQKTTSLVINCGSINEADLNDFVKVTTLTVQNGKEFTVPNTPKVFGKMPNLKKVILINNKITNIEGEPFKSNTKLEQLDLSQNADLKSFDFKIFSPDVKKITVKLPKTITTLNINCKNSDCRFNVEGNGVLEKIKKLDASKNRFENASDIMSKLGSTLDTLDLSHCKMDLLNSRLLEKFTNLSYLNLGGSQINEIEGRPFEYQTALVELDLSRMNLTEVDDTIFDKKFQSLKKLNLEHNNLTDVEIIKTDYFGQLKDLAIYDNEFTCVYLQEFVQRFNESFNLIKNPLASKKINVGGIDCSTDGGCMTWEIMTYTLVGLLSLVFIVIFSLWVIYRKRIFLKRTVKKEKPQNKPKKEQLKKPGRSKKDKNESKKSNDYDDRSEEVYEAIVDTTYEDDDMNQYQMDVVHKPANPSQYTPQSNHNVPIPPKPQFFSNADKRNHAQPQYRK